MKRILSLWILGAALGCGMFLTDTALGQDANSRIIYFLRHAEDVAELEGYPSFTVTLNNCTPDGSCCEEVLNPLGTQRAMRLADWFVSQHIARNLTQVIASHKTRTRQTVEHIAKAAGLGGDLDGDGDLDGTDVDQVPGDGVINVPSTPLECDPGFTSAGSATQPQIDYLRALPPGSRAVICSHSPVIYPIMQALGVDTSDPDKFPKTATGRVRGFNNLWMVSLDENNRGKLLQHLQLDFALEVSVIPRREGNAEFGRDDDND